MSIAMKAIFKSLIFFSCLIASVSFSIASAKNANFSLESAILSETRELVVYLPEGYDKKSQKPYDLIYMLDAGNDDVLMADTTKKLHHDGFMPKVIIVAIKNIRRGFDLTPPYALSGRGEMRKKGNGDHFAAFITEELIKTVDKKI